MTQVKFKRDTQVNIKNSTYPIVDGQLLFGTDSGQIYQDVLQGTVLARTPCAGTFDLVIRTQAEFEAMYNDPNWLGATSIAFVGDGGTLEFTKIGLGLVIPKAVKQIVGFNNATILHTNPITYGNSNPGTFAVMDKVIQSVYITGLVVKVQGVFNGNVSAFYGISSVRDCQVYIEGGGNLLRGYGGRVCWRCDSVSNCRGKVTTPLDAPTGNWAGYSECTKISNCTIQGDAGPDVSFVGIGACENISNCISMGYGFDVKGYRACKQLSNCTAEVMADAPTVNEVGFLDCSYCNGCKITPYHMGSIWGGTTLKRDDSSCDI